MMAAFNVTALTDLGYDEKTSFIDPMEPRYRNKFFSDSDFKSRSGDFSESAIASKVKFFNDLEAYRNKDGVEKALEQYWNTKVSSTVAATTKSKGGSTPTTLATVASSPAAVAAASSSSSAAAVAAGSSSPAVVASASTPAAAASSSDAPVASSSDAAVASPSAV
jgi:bilirubin oxidase